MATRDKWGATALVAPISLALAFSACESNVTKREPLIPDQAIDSAHRGDVDNVSPDGTASSDGPTGNTEWPPDATQPHLQRQGPNLIVNPSFTSADSWSPSNGAAVDSAVSRTPGSGSMKLTSGQVYSSYIPVEPGKTYTAAAYIRAASFPSIVSFTVWAYDADRKYIGARGGGRQINSVADVWQETAMINPTGEGEAWNRFVFNWYGTPTKNPVWIDDVYFGEGIGFEQPPALKRATDGTYFRIDGLGNFERRVDEDYVPFLPFCICSDGTRTSYDVYVQAGFNCIAWANNADQVRRAKDAGMVAGLQVGQYTNFNHQQYKDTATLVDRITEVHEQGLDDAVLMYYFDNENFYEDNINPANPIEFWTVTEEVLTAIESTELLLNGGKRMRPRHMLVQAEGISRLFSGHIDMISDYFGKSASADGDQASFIVLNNIEAQSAPLFAQLNPVKEGETPMRKWIYGYLIHGAKGFSFWRDVAPGNPNYSQPNQWGVVPIETTSWFSDLPIIRQELEQLSHVLRRPHWVTWQVRPSERSVIFGGREYGGEAYLILVNDGNVTAPVRFDMSGLTYAPVSVKDALTGEVVAPYSGTGFSYSFDGKETAILRLAAGS